MKSTLFIFAVLFGAALAEDAKALEAQEEGRVFVGLGTIMTLIQLGTQIIILLALINFVTSLKGSIDFDNLFGKGGDGYDYTGGYETGYDPTGYAAPATVYASPVASGVGGGSSYSSYRRQGNVEKRSLAENLGLQRLTAKVYDAFAKFTE